MISLLNGATARGLLHRGLANRLDEKQGRFTIEPHLLEYAGIRKDIEAIRSGRYWRLIAA